MKTDADIAEIRRRLSHAPKAVFDAFADPELISRWLKPSPEITLTVLAFKFLVGGAYRFQYRMPGGQTMTVHGAFQTIEPPRRIVFSWDIEPPDEHAGLSSVVSITISPAGQGSELLVRHAQLTRAGAPERHDQGWRGALDRLEQILDLSSERISP